jgi:glutamate synthase domain-containing protein 1
LTAANTGVAMIFLPQDETIFQATAKKTVEEIFVQEGFTWIGWRSVPTNAQCFKISRQALRIFQASKRSRHIFQVCGMSRSSALTLPVKASKKAINPPLKGVLFLLLP